MMTNLRQAAQQALEALESGDWYIDQLEMIVYYADDTGTHEERAKVQAAIIALRAALAEPSRAEKMRDAGYIRRPTLRELAEPEQEPVAWVDPKWIDPDTRGWPSDSFTSSRVEGWLPLYTAPTPAQAADG